MNGFSASYTGAELADEAPGDAASLPAPAWAEIHPARTAFDRLGPHWRDLAANASEPNAFAEPWFAAAALRHLEPASDMRMVEVWSGRGGEPSLIGLLPLTILRGYARIPVSFTQNWLHAHSFLGAPLVRSGHEQDFWLAVLVALDGSQWARNFLHICKLVEHGPVHRALVSAAGQLGRPCDTVHRLERALLESDLSPLDYYERTVRKKKRKELKRLSARLGELGRVETRTLTAEEDLPGWCDAFLSLERSGWKGRGGSALGCSPSTEQFFREAIAGAFKAGKLDFLRLDLDGRSIAMLVNFLTPPGSFSFKIAFDEDYSRFSPGVLIQIENFRVLAREEIGWMDSCAVEEHPMINSLWGERRPIVRVTIPLGAGLRQLMFRICRTIENGSAALRLLRRPADREGRDPNDE